MYCECYVEVTHMGPSPSWHCPQPFIAHLLLISHTIHSQIHWAASGQVLGIEGALHLVPALREYIPTHR